MLSKILSKEFCAECKFCCVFSKEARWEIPEEIKLDENDKSDLMPCPHLDKTQGCTLGDLKPIECKLWPLRVMEYCGKRYITVSSRCCAYSEKFVRDAISLLASGLAERIIQLANDNPQIVREYHSSYRLLYCIDGEDICGSSSVLFFRKAEIGDADRIMDAVSTEKNNICQYSCGFLIALADKYDVEISFNEGTLYVHIPLRDTETHCAYLMPIGGVGNVKDKLSLIAAHAASRGRKPMIWGAVSNDLHKICESGFKYKIYDERNWWDYVYRARDLAVLEGKVFHKKRTALNKFKRDYEGRFSYTSINESNIELIRKYQTKWLCRRFDNFGEDDGLAAENKQINYILDNFNTLGAIGGYVSIDGKIAGYTISLPLGDDTFDMTTLKTSRKYHNVTVYLVSSFAQSLPDDILYLNFEEDIGSEGLRKFKNDFNPAFMLKKGRVEFE